MKFTVHYIPINRIKPGSGSRMTQRLRRLRRFMWDGMHLMVVRRSRKSGDYVILSGNSRYDYLRSNTRKMYAPCIIDEERRSDNLRAWWSRRRNRRLLQYFPNFSIDRIPRSSLGIIRSFLKQQPRFKELNRTGKIRVLLLGIRYRRTTAEAMKRLTEELLNAGGRDT